MSELTPEEEVALVDAIRGHATGMAAAAYQLLREGSVAPTWLAEAHEHGRRYGLACGLLMDRLERAQRIREKNAPESHGMRRART